MPEITGVPIFAPVCNCSNIPMTHIHVLPQNGGVVPDQLAEVHVNGALVAIIIEQSGSGTGPTDGTTVLSSRSVSSIPHQ